MPRMKRTGSVWEPITALIRGRMSVEDMNLQDLANCTTMCAATLSTKIKNPGKFTCEELIGICKVLDIKVDELRQSIRFS